MIFVTDLAKAKTFYVDLLGLPVAGQSEMLMEFFPGASTTLGVSLALHEDARKLVGRHTGITLRVEKIEAVCERSKPAGSPSSNRWNPVPGARWRLLPILTAIRSPW